ncbi:hypothetical protein [Salinimicrobium sp. GXAS 041]|uniref:hypothetical protein n=1 Tax=Salinimicrobium sp. GXAS 041 TaxID=3400806 RepID=UPI003C796CD2
MKTNREPNSENRKTSNEQPQEDGNDKLQPKPNKNEEEKQDSPFLKKLKKIGFSVWLGVMIVGAALAFIASILLL